MPGHFNHCKDDSGLPPDISSGTEEREEGRQTSDVSDIHVSTRVLPSA